MFHAGARNVYRTVFSTHRHPASTNPAHSVSVPIRHPINKSDKKSSAVTNFKTDIYLHRKCSKIPGRYAVYSRVWRLGCFGAWGRGSWHFQVASSHFLQSIMNHFVRFTLFFHPADLCVRTPPAERSALDYIRYSSCR